MRMIKMTKAACIAILTLTDSEVEAWTRAKLRVTQAAWVCGQLLSSTRARRRSLLELVLGSILGRGRQLWCLCQKWIQAKA
mmetsp:Transcript_136653/g.340783  ORF Transcript_136653/g.340783 Transcript_136653/m.340783 type:complete len:81 (-) Transcript_136653:976-1218(-)